MITKIYSATLRGIDAILTTIEVDVVHDPEVRGSFILGGIGENSTDIRNRITHALRNSGYSISGKRIMVNVTPALFKNKRASHLFDLPVALAILNSLGEVRISDSILNGSIFCGELMLDGSLNGISGALAIAFGAEKLHKDNLFVPGINAAECARVDNIKIYGIHNLNEVVNHLNGDRKVSALQANIVTNQRPSYKIDYLDVYGQDQVKRALQIASAGFHNVLMIGSPGSGKTMLAERMKTIMTLPKNDELLETNKIYSIAGNLKDNAFMYERPFRAPHHTISKVGLVGGGPTGQPGEISLAHNGILFLDELTEFSTRTIEVLRQPLEQKKVLITRADYSTELPANFILIAACNPCPCGYYGDDKKKCVCSILVRDQYFKKLSGPFLDRIDLQVSVSSVSFVDLQSKRSSKSSREMAREVENAVAIQMKRNDGVYNGLLNNQEIKKHCSISPTGEKLMEFAFHKLGISARSYHRILKIARTIADLNASESIEDIHLKEALMFRSLDKNIS